MASTCPTCQSFVPPDATFCPTCGTSLHPPARVTMTPVTRSSEPGAPVWGGPLLGVSDLIVEIGVLAVAVGIVGSIPCLNVLNCCCCLPQLGGVWLGLGVALRRRDSRVSFRALLLSGLLIGIGSGVLIALGAYVTALLTPASDVAALREMLNGVQGMPDAWKERLSDWETLNALGLLVNLPMYAGSGAVAGVLGAWGAARTMLADRVHDDG